MIKKIAYKWKVLLALSIIILCSIYTPKLVFAVDESDTWIIPKGSYNEDQKVVSTRGDYIIQVGKHPKGHSSILYRTVYMYMTLNAYPDTYTKAHVLDNVPKARFDISTKSHDIPGEDMVESTYTIKKVDFINAAKSLGITSKVIKDHGGSITVYVHNVFEIYNPHLDGMPVYDSYTDILGYQDMIDEGDKITGYHGGWPDDTEEALHYYYNFPYVIKPTLFNVKVLAVEKGSQDVLGTLKSGDSGMIYENYPLDGSYTADEYFKGKDGTTYKAVGSWYCLYTPRIGDNAGKEIRGKTYTGRTISEYTLPDAKKDSTVKLCIVYEKVSLPKANIVINAIDEQTDTKIMELYKGSNITASATFTQPMNTVRATIDDYVNAGKYSFSYTDSEGVKRTGTGKGDGPVSIFVPRDIKNNSTITVSVYYKKTNSGDIPVTIKAVDKKTGEKITELGSGIVKGGALFEDAKSIQENLLSGGKSYSFSGSWEWSYTRNTSTKPTVKTAGSGMKISFKAPSSDGITGGIEVKVYYDQSTAGSGEITLKVLMVGSTGATIETISQETVTRSQAVTKTAKATRSVEGISYNYMDRWEYSYVTSSGTTVKNGTGSKISFTVPSNTSFGSVVVLKLFYDGTPEVEVPTAEDPISVSLDSPTPDGVINGDPYGSPYFTSKQGISTTESQYVYVKTKDYLLGYTLLNRTGKMTYYVSVTMNYNISYQTATPEEFGGPKEVKEVVKDTQKVKVERAYSYWEITNLEYYYVDSANIYNYSLPDGKAVLSANNSYLDIPSLSTWHNSSPDDHVLAPKQVKEGIEVWADETITSETSERPEVEFKDLTSYALEQTGEAQVKNDSLVFGGSVVLSSSLKEKIAPEPNTSKLRQCTTICGDKALYTENKVVDAEKENGTYTSNGSVTYYLHSESVNAYTSTRSYNAEINSVTIQTPVICDPIVNADNDMWNQQIKPEAGAVQLVLDPDTSLNDFTVRISNTLEHSNRLGYYTRDFSRSFIDPENISYIAKLGGIVRNEMKLPFDVYLDTLEDNKQKNDQFIKAGTWIILGRAASRFYVPMWVPEGSYTAEFCTIAVNGTDKLTRTEKTRNASLSNYVATDTRQFQISGRIYGLSLYDISDYPRWEEVFREDNTMLFKLFEGAVDGTKKTNYNKDYSYYYTVGTKNQYGISTGRYEKYTIPLVNGSHPNYKNLGVLKTGYAVRFRLDTTGEMYGGSSSVKITPTFYYVSAKGKNRQQVDLYYNEEINGVNYRVVKVGQGIDLVNIQTGTTGNIYSRIPENELSQTAAVMNTTYSKIANQTASMYSYSEIKLLKQFRTFIGTDYASSVTGLNSFQKVKNATGQTKTNLSKYMQRWYGTYKIPTNVHAVPSGYDVAGYMKKYGIDYGESFWLKGGYIIVNFNIVTIDKNGKQQLSYINGNNYLSNGNCSMWVTEGAPLQKTDYKGKTFQFKAGDYIIYDTDKKSSDDYEGVLY